MLVASADVIDVSHLSKRHGRRWVLDDVSFTAADGRVTALLGPNGAGKSSTLRVLLGLDRADGGVALFDGTPYRRLRSPLRTVGAMLDGSGAHRSRTVRAHLRWVARSNGLPASRVQEVIELVGLGGAARRRAGALSLGMGRRLGLACALLGDPHALVLDEPANGLDPDGIRWIRELLRARADAGATVLVCSHLMHETETIADDVVVLAAGRVIGAGPVATLTAGHGSLEAAFLALTRAEAG